MQADLAATETREGIGFIRSGAIDLKCVANGVREAMERPTNLSGRHHPYLLERAVDQAKMAAAGMSVTEPTDLVDRVVQWAREQ